MRAIAVLVVILSHVAEHAPGIVPPWAVAWAASLGALGVRVFFVISGLLITSLVLDDAERHGGVRLGRFYFRRALRILPPCYVFLAVVTLATTHGWLAAEGRVWPAWTFTTNVAPTGWTVAHTWSLAVEEQFYVTWPLVLASLGRERAVRVALAACVAMPFVRVAVAVAMHSGWIGANVAFDVIGVGCLLAIRPPIVERALIVLTRRGWIAAALVVVVILAEGAAASMGARGASAELVLLESLQAVTFGAVVAWCIAHPASGVGRFLNSRVLAGIGIGSYSVYLWQQVFFGPNLARLTIPGAALATAATAGASYLAVERPALALRAHLERLLHAGARDRAVAAP